MEPISAWTATSQEQLESGNLILRREVQDYRLTIVAADFCLWIVATWPGGGRIAFRAAYAANDKLEIKNIEENQENVIFTLAGATGKIVVNLQFPDTEKPIFRYTTTITPAFDLLIPYWPRDIMPLHKRQTNTQNTKGKVHASQVGSRSGLLFLSLEKPETGSVFYFQNLTALNKYCEDTETPAGDLVGGVWPELGMKLPVTTVEKPLKAGKEYIISDAFVLLSPDIPEDTKCRSSLSIILPTSTCSYHGLIPNTMTG